MTLTKAQRRMLLEAAQGKLRLAPGGNGSSRACLQRLQRDGLMEGHVLTPKGREALTTMKEG
jgi:hypothetical protein